MSLQRAAIRDPIGFLRDRFSTKDFGAGELVNYINYNNLPSIGSQDAKLNELGVWRDENAGNVWVPDYLKDWNLKTFIHADTENPESPTSGWAKAIVGAGTVTIDTDRIQCDSGDNADDDTGGYGYTIPGLGANDDIVVVYRGLVSSPSGTLDTMRVPDLADSRTDTRVRFNSRDAAGALLHESGTAKGGKFAAQTVERVYVLEYAQGETADDQVQCWLLEARHLRAFAPASSFASVAQGSDYVYFSPIRTGGIQAVFRLHWCIVYLKDNS
jgi:hypothetical protein